MANLDRRTGIVGRQIVFEYVFYREGDYNGTLGSKTGFVIETYLGADSSAYSDQVFSITFLLVRMEDGSIEHVPAYRLKDIVY